MDRRLFSCMNLNRESLAVAVVFIILTILVSGLFALDRGIFHDDILGFSAITSYEGHPLMQLFGAPVRSPTRIFFALPQTVATWLGMPTLFFNILFVGIWFFIGVCSYSLMVSLFPSRKDIAFFAGALALTSTGDAAMNTSVSLYFSVLCYFAAVIFLLKWWKHEGRKWLFPSGICLSLSVWTYDAAFAAILMTPILLWVIDEFRLTARLITGVFFWYAIITPYLIVFFGFLFDANSYAAQALVTTTFAHKVTLITKLFVNNFTPWQWALGWRHWFPAPPHLLPIGFRLVLTAIGTIAFGLVGLRLSRQNQNRMNPSNERVRYVFVGLLCLLMAVASNAIYGFIQLSEFYLRTQLVSGIWGSMVIALLAYGLAAFFVFKHPTISLILPTFFVSLGIYGGLESQDYLLGYWRQHKAELRSIIQQVPAIKPDTTLILYVPPAAPFLATEAEYLARCWISILYDDPSLDKYVFLWSERRNTRCINSHNGFICRGENREESVIPYEKSVLLVYSPLKNRYILQDTLPDYLLSDSDIKPVGYDPNAQIIHRGYSAEVLSILYGSEYLTSFFKHEEISTAGDGEMLSQYSPSKVRRSLHVGSIDLFETEGGPFQLKGNSLIHAAGWAYDPYTKKPVDFVLIVDRDKPFMLIRVKYIRQDVADATGNKNLARTGWDINFLASELGKGEHRMEFFAPLSDGSFAPLISPGRGTFFNMEIR